MVTWLGQSGHDSVATFYQSLQRSSLHKLWKWNDANYPRTQQVNFSSVYLYQTNCKHQNSKKKLKEKDTPNFWNILVNTEKSESYNKYN